MLVFPEGVSGAGVFDRQRKVLFALPADIQTYELQSGL
jgi:hypothetical protein